MSQTDALKLFLDTKSISDKLCLWCRIVDGRDLSRMHEIFDSAIHWDYGKGTAEDGLENITNRIRIHLVDSNTECGLTHHHLANVHIDIDGDDAESEAYFEGVHAGTGSMEGKVLTQWGNYHDFWKRTACGWRIVRRFYRIDISEGPLEIVYGNVPETMWQEGDERKIGSRKV